VSWRTVVISKRCKLDYKMGYMVIRSEETKRVFLDEVAVLMIENPAVSFTGVLLAALTEKKIKVLFCDAKRNPYGELVPYYGSFDASRKVKQQTEWSPETKALIWQAIIAEKINNQAEHLFEQGKKEEGGLLLSYIPQIVPGDKTNREGHAAKVYFNALFGKDFRRSDDNPINAALNYGYAILLSAFNRAVVSSGYLTEIGVHHDNIYNYFNLSSDIMEPYRILVDRIVKEQNLQSFDKKAKYALVDVLNKTVVIDRTRQTVLNGITIYTKSVLTALNEADPGAIRHYHLL